jgi:hypothetical protein
MIVEMTIELDFNDLRKLAANTQLVKDGITIKVNRPVHPTVNMPAAEGDEYVVFALASGDPRSKDFKWDANIQR